MLISTIVLSVTGGRGAASAAGGGSKGFVEKQHERLGNFLKYLESKVGDALPEILGTAVSFLIRVAAKVAEFVGKHLYLGIAGATALAVAYIR